MKCIGKKLRRTIAIGSLFCVVTTNAMATDVIVFGLTGYGFLEQTQDTVRAMTHTDAIGVVIGLLYLPFAILDEKTKEISTNSNDLYELGYSYSEIAEYQEDLNLIALKKFSSVVEAKQEISKMDLGIIAREQLRIK